MISWKNLDTLNVYKKFLALKGRVNIVEAMAGENGAKRVAEYSVPMACGMKYNFAAKAVDDTSLDVLQELADEHQLIAKYEELLGGAVINTGEKRLVLHQLCRGQLKGDVIADGVNKRDFYVSQQKKAADFANKVHAGEITNAAGEKFTTAVQIGIGGSDLGPRAIYLALENWAKTNDSLKMEARFISNVDPDDAAAVLTVHRCFQVRHDSGDPDQRVLRARCSAQRRCGSVQTHAGSHQRDFPSCIQLGLSGSLLYG